MNLKQCLDRAVALLGEGRLDEAAAICREVLERSPGHPDALHLLGLGALRRGRPDEAREHIGRAAAARADVPAYRFNLGLACAAAGDDAAAAQAYAQVLELVPGHPGALVNLGVALVGAGHVEQGVARLTEAVETDPNSPAAWNNLGNALAAAGRAGDAVEAYRRAVGADPDFAPARDNLGKALLEGGDPAEAAEHFARAVALDPREPAYGMRLRQAYAEQVPAWHFPMVNDTARNEAYRRAIERAVRADMVVLDVGTGTGLLAMAAARAGAAEVVACEMVPPIAAVARDIVAANGFGDRIRIEAKRSTELAVGRELPRRADLVVHEIFDNGVLGEHVVGVLEHVRAELAVKDAVILPRAAEIIAQPLESEALWRANRVDRALGFDVSAFNRLAAPTLVPLRVGDYPYRPLAEAQRLFRLDFGGAPIRPDAVERQFAVESGTCHAVAVWMRIEFDDEITFETGPDGASSHWMQAVQVLDRPRPTDARTPLVVDAEHDRCQVFVAVAE